MKLEFSVQFLEKYSNIKFHENPSGGEPRCFMRTNRRTDMPKLIVAFRNFANAPKNQAALGVYRAPKKYISLKTGISHIVPTIDRSLEFANICFNEKSYSTGWKNFKCQTLNLRSQPLTYRVLSHIIVIVFPLICTYYQWFLTAY